MELSDFIQEEFDRSARLLKQTAEQSATAIAQAAEMLAGCIRQGGKVIIFGNGGSAADAQHFAAELVGRFRRERRSLPALALNSDTAMLTAIGNDYGFDQVFARQVESLAKPGDLVIGITTSGRSPNVRKGLVAAQVCGADTLMLSGEIDPSEVSGLDQILLLQVPSKDTARVQEAHIVIIHTLCELLERSLYKDNQEDRQE